MSGRDVPPCANLRRILGRCGRRGVIGLLVRHRNIRIQPGGRMSIGVRGIVIVRSGRVGGKMHRGVRVMGHMVAGSGGVRRGSRM